MEVKVEVKKWIHRVAAFCLPTGANPKWGGKGDIHFKGKGHLKIILKRKVDLTEYFDKVDLNIESFEDWKEFEKNSIECVHEILRY